MTVLRLRLIEILLRKIEDIGVEIRAASNHDPVVVDRLRRKLFRHIGICESLSLEDRGVNEGRRFMEEEIAELRRELGADEQALSDLAVDGPISTIDSALGHPPRFPHLLRLSQSVRSYSIFSQLTSAQDRRAAGNAFPEEASLLGWNMASLNLEAVLPHVLEKELIGSCELQKMCGANGQLNNAILRQFTETLEGPNLVFPVEPIGNILRRHETKAPSGPVPVTASFAVSRETMANVRVMLKQLSQFPGLISDAMILFSNEDVVENMKIIRDILTHLPSLVRLNISGYIDREEIFLNVEGIVDAELHQLKSIALPTLPHLKSLTVSPLCSADEAFWRVIIGKYSSQLCFFNKTDLPLQCATLCNNKWTRLTRINMSFIRDVSYLTELIAALEGVPLKIFELGNSFFTVEEFLLALAELGDSLEEIYFGSNLCASDILWTHVGSSNDVIDKSWIVRLNFPRVRKLYLGSTVSNWDMLLLFPALESLTLKNEYTNPNTYFQGSCFFDLSWDKHTMQNSDLWKLLPDLKTIELKKCDTGRAVSRSLTIRRNGAL